MQFQKGEGQRVYRYWEQRYKVGSTGRKSKGKTQIREHAIDERRKLKFPYRIKEARCWWRSWLRHCATSRKVACSIPDGVIGIFH